MIPKICMMRDFQITRENNIYCNDNNTNMAVITVRIDDETKKLMNEIRINWSEFIREAIRKKIEEEKNRNLAKAILINERLRKKSEGEAKAEEIIRQFREDRYGENRS